MEVQQYQTRQHEATHEMTAREILAANFRTLRDRHPAYMSDLGIENATKAMGNQVGRTTVNKVSKGTTPLNLDDLETLAILFGVTPWQILVPGLDPEYKPLLANHRAQGEIDSLRKEMLSLLSAIEQRDPKTLRKGVLHMLTRLEKVEAVMPAEEVKPTT